ncbi:MAG: hypothetical protein MUF54_12265 [Polyangiaceae bacterium]|nr:hypothetical protein [Polyangiaceae bacterium]
MRFRVRLVALMTAALAGCGGGQQEPEIPPVPVMPLLSAQAADLKSNNVTPTPTLTVAPDIHRRLAQFAPVVMDFDETKLATGQKQLLKKLVEASQLMHQLFLLQIDASIPTLRARLAQIPGQEAALRYFDIMAGPWDALKQDEPFIGGTPRPPGGTFHPPDLTKAEFDAFVKANPPQKDALLGYFTAIRRQGDKLQAVPYSKVWSEPLRQASAKLQEAATFATEPTLKEFLDLRAKAFVSNEYRESDMAWMDVTGPVEVTIGPYETYADQLLGLKASFEAFVSLRDESESKKLAIIGAKMNALERNLPMSTEQRKRMAERSQRSPIDVVQLLFAAGQSSVHTVAYNLPNDEYVRKEKGSKKVMMKNVIRGKFDLIVVPIAERVLAKDQRADLDFEAMFSYVLMHEIAHGLGPGLITLPGGTKSEVNKALRDQYGAIEEAKADIAGLVSAQHLIDQGVLPKAYNKQAYVAYLATVLRQVRFGVGGAHGRGAVASFNYLRDKGGISYDPSAGTFGIDFKNIKSAVRSLAEVYLTLQVDGDYNEAKAFLDKHAKVSPEMQQALDRIGADVPVDIRPTFTIQDKMARW